MLSHPSGTDLLRNTLGDFEPGLKDPVRANHDLTTGTSAERAVSLLSLASTPIAVTTGCERQVRVEFQLGATAVPFRLSLQPRALERQESRPGEPRAVYLPILRMVTSVDPFPSRCP